MDSLVFAILTIFSLAIGTLFSIKKIPPLNALISILLFAISVFMMVDNTIDYYQVITYTNSSLSGTVTYAKTITISHMQPVFPLIPLIIFLLSVFSALREIA